MEVVPSIPFEPEVDRWYALRSSVALRRNDLPPSAAARASQIARDLPLIYYINNKIDFQGETYYWAVGINSGWVKFAEIERPSDTASRLRSPGVGGLEPVYLAALMETGGRWDREREVATFTASLRRFGPNFNDYYHRAAAYRALRNYTRALGDLTDALRFHPESIDALLFRAEVNARLKRPLQTRADLVEVLRIDPKNEKARVGLAVLEIQTFDKNP